MRDPAGFETQEERRRLYLLMKKEGTVVRKAAIALPALACKWFLEPENKWFHDDPYDIADHTISSSLDEPEPSPIVFPVDLRLGSARGV